MLTRALLVLLGIGLVAAAASRDYNSNDNYREENSKPEINQTKIFCYLNATRIFKSSVFRFENLKLDDHCTHIVYGAAFINSNNEVEPINRELERGPGAVTFAQLSELKTKNNVKILLSIHGSYHQFSSMARGSRSTFVGSVSHYLNRHGFDGVNIDWQYPGRGGNAVDDKQNYNLLIQELKTNIRGSGKLVTVSLPPTRPDLNNGFDYDNDIMLESVDYWFIMALEYYNHVYATIGANAPIIGNDGSHDVTSTINFIMSKTRLKRDRLKLILVVPFYGKLYLLDSELRSGESPIGQRFTNRNSVVDSVLSYRDVCASMQSAGIDNWMRATDRNSRTPYAVYAKRALLYEDPVSIAEKTNLAMKSGLGGVMAFSLDLDDFDGTCANEHNGRTLNRHNQGDYHESTDRLYPLLRAMYDTVQRGGNGAGTAGLSLFLAFLAATFLTIHG